MSNKLSTENTLFVTKLEEKVSKERDRSLSPFITERSTISRPNTTNGSLFLTNRSSFDHNESFFTTGHPTSRMTSREMVCNNNNNNNNNTYDFELY